MKEIGSGALSGKMLLVRIIVKYRLALPSRFRKIIRIGPYRVRTLFYIILDPAFYHEVHLVKKLI